MKFYLLEKINRLSGKTWKDQKNYEQVILYHASPEKISHLMPRSTFWGYSGLFMSPSYKSTIKDWAFYVTEKRKYSHPLQIKWKTICRDMDRIRDKIEKIEKENPSSDLLIELKLQLHDLEEKRGEISDSLNKDSFTDTNRGYQTLYIHKIGCPKNVYKQSLDLLDKAQNSGYRADNFGFWGLGSQVFIVDKWFSYLEIISIEKMNREQLIERYEDMDRRPYDMKSFKDPRYNQSLNKQE